MANKSQSIAVYKSDAYWRDIGSVEEYIKANEDILSGDYHLE